MRVVDVDGAVVRVDRDRVAEERHPVVGRFAGSEVEAGLSTEEAEFVGSELHADPAVVAGGDQAGVFVGRLVDAAAEQEERFPVGGELLHAVAVVVADQDGAAASGRVVDGHSARVVELSDAGAPPWVLVVVVVVGVPRPSWTTFRLGISITNP
jgi:hypothetical protein